MERERWVRVFKGQVGPYFPGGHVSHLRSFALSDFNHTVLQEESQSSDLCDRVQASLDRIVDIDDFVCEQMSEGHVTISGRVASREESLMCGITARVIPGVSRVVNRIKARRQR